jgi:cyclohexa-1,5-dienecarbonyl-CoA hydratase
VAVSDREPGVLIDWRPGLAVVYLARPRANILDKDMIAALRDALGQVASRAGARAMILTAQGESFSYGASVAEHVRERAGEMIRGFCALCLELYRMPVPVVAAVKGHCLGGALELVLASHVVVAAPEARLGLPEVTLGVYPPVAAAMLSAGIARPGVEELALSGRTVTGQHAERIGLVDRGAVAGQDPLEVAEEYFRDHLSGSSAASQRVTCRALRGARASAFERELAVQERLYLEELMAMPDANEGIAAFIEKRRPVWKDR